MPKYLCILFFALAAGFPAQTFAVENDTQIQQQADQVCGDLPRGGGLALSESTDCRIVYKQIAKWSAADGAKWSAGDSTASEDSQLTNYFANVCDPLPQSMWADPKCVKPFISAINNLPRFRDSKLRNAIAQCTSKLGQNNKDGLPACVAGFIKSSDNKGKKCAYFWSDRNFACNIGFSAAEDDKKTAASPGQQQQSTAY
jgi:hypothetical protein